MANKLDLTYNQGLLNGNDSTLLLTLDREK